MSSVCFTSSVLLIGCRGRQTHRTAGSAGPGRLVPMAMLFFQRVRAKPKRQQRIEISGRRASGLAPLHPCPRVHALMVTQTPPRES